MDVSEKGGKVPMDERVEKSIWMKSERVEKSLCVIRKRVEKSLWYGTRWKSPRCDMVWIIQPACSACLLPVLGFAVVAMVLGFAPP